MEDLNTVKIMFVLVLLIVLFMLIGDFVNGTHGMLFIFMITLVFNFFTCWFSDKIVLRMYRVKPAPDDLNLTEVIRHVLQMTGRVIRK
jgi:heat shock protein HtpX